MKPSPVITAENADTLGDVHFKSLIDSNFLGQWDLPKGREVTVVIESLRRYTPPRPMKKHEPQCRRQRGCSCPIEPCKRIDVGFKGKKKHWLSGPATQAVIAKMYGPKLKDWIGKPITLYVDESVTFGLATTGGIRVRASVQGQPTDDPLDRDVDEAAAEQIEAAKSEFYEDAREPGED